MGAETRKFLPSAASWEGPPALFPLGLVNARTGEWVASDVELALTRSERKRGLLGREGLDPSKALVIAPCPAIHTAFMRFTIDVVFVDRSGYAVHVVHELRPWRLAISPRAHAVIELAGGCLREREIRVGDCLYLAPAPGADASASSAGVLMTLRMTAAKPAWSGS